MWFRVLSLVIAASLFTKAAIALAIPQRFYAARQRQYASRASSRGLLVPPTLVLLATAVSWYALVFRYRPWGELVTVFLTGLSCLAIDHVVRWERHRHAMLRVVASPKTRWLDCLLLFVAIAFGVLAFSVF